MSAAALAPSTGPRLGDWVMAARPKTLVAAVIPVAVGTAIASGAGGARALPAAAALLGALLIQIGTNLTNDYYDFIRGADTAERVGPQRVTQSGLIAPRTVFLAAMSAFALAMLVGSYLVYDAGWSILVIGLVSILAGFAYTGGPFPLAYHGLGDLFVLVFFGPVAVGGTAFVQTHRLDPAPLVIGLSLGLLSTGLLAVNNLRDAETDARAGKRTLVVRFGVAAGRAEYLLAVGLGLATPLLLWGLGWAPTSVLLALGAIPVAMGPVRLVLTGSGRRLNAAIGGTARVLALYGLLLCVGLALRWR